jgi:hypothetical protein
VNAPGGEPRDERADPGEGRLAAYLAELRVDPPVSDEALVRRVQRNARWQQAVRGPLEVIGHLTGAFADGVAALLGDPRRQR